MVPFSSFRWDRGNLHHGSLIYLLIAYCPSTLSVAIAHTSEIRCFGKKRNLFSSQIRRWKSKVVWGHLLSLWCEKGHPKWWWRCSMGWGPGVLDWMKRKTQIEYQRSYLSALCKWRDCCTFLAPWFPCHDGRVTRNTEWVTVKPTFLMLPLCVTHLITATNKKSN